MNTKRVADKCIQIIHTLYDAFLPNSIVQKNKLKRLLKAEVKSHKHIIPLIEDNRKYHNIHKDKRCFVIGNGPSLKQTDISLLKNEICFTVNFLNLSPLFEQIQPCYHVMADPTIFSDHDPDRDKAVDLVNKIKKMDHPVKMFLDYRIRQNGIEKGFLNGIDSSPMLIANDFLTDCDGYNIDLSMPMNPFQNVVQFAISIAVYMGFSEIYLLGCDATDFLNAADYKLGVSHGTHAYDEKINSDFAEHFKLEPAFYSYYRTFKEYRLLNDYCRNHGIKLANCTVGGVLDSIPRMKLEDVVCRRL